MKVIVVRQPWAWLIVNGFMDIENRTWRTNYPLLIQASAHLPPKRKLEEHLQFARERGVQGLPGEFQLGGIIGTAELKDCVSSSPSKWFEGPIGWVLAEARTVPFIEMKGRLGLFDPPHEVRAHFSKQLGRRKVTS